MQNTPFDSTPSTGFNANIGSGNTILLPSTQAPQKTFATTQRRSDKADLKTLNHFLFFDPASENVQHRVDEVQLIKPTWNFQLVELRPHDTIGQMAERLAQQPQQSVGSVWLVAGSETGSSRNESTRTSSRKRKSDKRILRCSAALNEQAQFYLLGSDHQELAEQIEQTLSTPVRFDFDSPVNLAFDEVIFVDAGVQNYDAMVRQLLYERDADVVLLDGGSDGLLQIAEHLSKRSRLRAVHIVCSGAGGMLVLGDSMLNARSIESEHQTGLEQIGKALASDGDIRIYGCRFNSGTEGSQAVKLLSACTGAFIVVSHSAPEACAMVPAENAQERIDSELNARFSLTHDSLLPPVDFSLMDEVEIDSTTEISPTLKQASEVHFRYNFDVAQAIGWLTVGIATGILATIGWMAW